MAKPASRKDLIASYSASAAHSHDEKRAMLIAESIDWSEVQAVASTCRDLPAAIASYVQDEQQRRAVRTGLPATVALMVDLQTIEAVNLQASAPRYLDLPPILVSLARDPDFLASRPLGRLMYRDAMFEQGTYNPLVFGQKDVLDLMQEVVFPSEKRLALVTPLAGRVGVAVGFLSGLSVAQADIARNGMAVMAALVAPLLVASPPAQVGAPAGNRAARRAAKQTKALPAPRKVKKGVQHG